jgi:hypothetical protein
MLDDAAVAARQEGKPSKEPPRVTAGCAETEFC